MRLFSIGLYRPTYIYITSPKTSWCSNVLNMHYRPYNKIDLKHVLFQHWKYGYFGVGGFVTSYFMGSDFCVAV